MTSETNKDTKMDNKKQISIQEVAGSICKEFPHIDDAGWKIIAKVLTNFIHEERKKETQAFESE